MTKMTKRFALAGVAAAVLTGAAVALPAQAEESTPVETSPDGSCYVQVNASWSTKSYLYPGTGNVERDPKTLTTDINGDYIGDAAIDGWTGSDSRFWPEDGPLGTDGWFDHSGTPNFRVIVGSAVPLSDATATIKLENATVEPGATWIAKQPAGAATPERFKQLTVDGLGNPVASDATTVTWELGTLNANTTAVADEEGNITLQPAEGEEVQGSSAMFFFEPVRDSALDETKEPVTAELTVTGTYEMSVPCPAPETTPEETPLPTDTDEPTSTPTETEAPSTEVPATTEAPAPSESAAPAPSDQAGKGDKNAGGLATTGAAGLPALIAAAVATIAGGSVFMLRRRKADA